MIASRDFMPNTDHVRSDRRERLLAGAIFGLVLAFHLWGVTVAWTSLNLPGNEFRQAQTAISAYFIQRDHDFSPAYPMPVLGKPWSVPFEFPLYQWTTVVLSNATGLPLTEAGRAVSVACFYLALPAVWLLLGRMGLARPRRLLVLSVILACPLHFIYVRAFLMETMALMFSLWFLQAFVAAVERRSGWWLLAANLAGIGAGLVKVTTFMLYLMPAGAWGLWWLAGAWPRRDRPGGGWPAVARIAGWVAAAVAAPFAATWGWIRYADAVKLLNPVGRSMVSSALTSFEFGTWQTRFSPQIWAMHGDILIHDLAPPAVLAIGAVLAGFTPRRWRIWSLGCVAFFGAVQLLFPVLYALHDYYYAANAILLMAALGLVLAGLLERARFRWVAWAALLAVVVLQAHTYLQGYYPAYREVSRGGNDLTWALRDLTRPDDVLVIAGEDWSPITPYSAERRALMLTWSEARDEALVRAAFEQLKGESVPVLLLHGQQRSNTALIRLAGDYFDIDPEPVVSWRDDTLYLVPELWHRFIAGIRRPGRYWNMQLSEAARAEDGVALNREAMVRRLSAGKRALFAGMSPQPYRYYTRFGLSNTVVDGRTFFNVHPDMKLWFRVPAGRHTITAVFFMEPGAYQNLARVDASDGVDLAIRELKSDGSQRDLYWRRLNPRDNPADRGLQSLEATADIAEGSEVLFVTHPGPQNSYNRDWTWLGSFTIR